MLAGGAFDVVGDCVGGGVVPGSAPVPMVVGAAVVATVVNGTDVVDGGICGSVVDVVGVGVPRLVTLACRGAGRSLLQAPTLPTAAVASKIDAAVASSHAPTDTIFRLMGSSWYILAP